MSNGHENLSDYARKIDYYREYYSRPEVKQRRRKYMKKYYSNPKVKQMMNKYHYIYYHNNVDYIMLARFVNRKKRELERYKTDYGIYHQHPYSKFQEQSIIKYLKGEVEMYQKYLDSYKEFRKEISGIKDEEAKSELKERFLLDLAKRIGRYR